MLFHSTFRSELSRYFWATLVVLVSIVMTVLLIRTLGQASRGNIDPAEVSLVLGYTVLGNMHTIVTLSLYIASVATLSRLYADSEMVIWQSSGKSSVSLLRPALVFAAPVLLVVAGLALVVWPWTNAQTHEIRERYEKRGDLEFIEFGDQGRERALEFLGVGLLGGGVLALHEFHHYPDIVDFLLKRDDREHGFFQAVELGDVLLGLLVAIPEIGRAHLGVHGLEHAPANISPALLTCEVPHVEEGLHHLRSLSIVPRVS